MASSDDEFTTAILGLSMSSALRPNAFQLARRLGELALRLRRVIEEPFFELYGRNRADALTGTLGRRCGTRQWVRTEEAERDGVFLCRPGGKRWSEADADTSFAHPADWIEQHAIAAEARARKTRRVLVEQVVDAGKHFEFAHGADGGQSGRRARWGRPNRS